MALRTKTIAFCLAATACQRTTKRVHVINAHNQFSTRGVCADAPQGRMTSEGHEAQTRFFFFLFAVSGPLLGLKIDHADLTRLRLVLVGGGQLSKTQCGNGLPRYSARSM